MPARLFWAYTSDNHDVDFALISNPPEMNANHFRALEQFLQVIAVLLSIDKASTLICLGNSHGLPLIKGLRDKAMDCSRREG